MSGESAYRTVAWAGPPPNIPACKAHNASRTLQVHVPPTTPQSWEENVAHGVDRDAGDCPCGGGRPAASVLYLLATRTRLLCVRRTRGAGQLAPRRHALYARAVCTAYPGTTGDCYSRDDTPRNVSKNQFGEIRVNQGCCCCSFWNSTPAVKSVRSLLQLSDPSAPKSTRTASSTLEPGCVRSFPAAWSRPVRAQRAPLRRCDIAVTLSGGLGWRINGLACSLDSLSRHVLQKQPGTCVFVHAGLIRPTTTSLAEAVGLNVTKILDSYASEVLAYELESNDRSTRKAIQNATAHCTRSGGVVGTLFSEIIQRQRHAKFQDKARYSFASMFRRSWLACQWLGLGLGLPT